MYHETFTFLSLTIMANLTSASVKKITIPALEQLNMDVAFLEKSQSKIQGINDLSYFAEVRQVLS
jgi:hypothetical protein